MLCHSLSTRSRFRRDCSILLGIECYQDQKRLAELSGGDVMVSWSAVDGYTIVF
jgi:hypothetical protein